MDLALPCYEKMIQSKTLLYKTEGHIWRYYCYRIDHGDQVKKNYFKAVESLSELIKLMKIYRRLETQKFDELFEMLAQWESQINLPEYAEYKNDSLLEKKYQRIFITAIDVLPESYSSRLLLYPTMIKCLKYLSNCEKHNEFTTLCHTQNIFLSQQFMYDPHLSREILSYL